ncbi:MAG TPA: glycosyltransferase family 4 protein [Burkholderiales bacterium]|nr:glycosyltransferase family 4 protein [Burkholderiales bacterium]
MNASHAGPSAGAFPPLKIVLVTHFFPAHRGGVEAVAAEIAVRLAASGAAEITWFASDTDSPPRDAPNLRCVPARSWNAVERALGFPFPLWSPGALTALWRQVRACDAVHLHDCLYLPNVVAWLAAAAARRPVVITQHIGHIPFRNPLLSWILAGANRVLGKLLLARSARAIFVSDAVLRYFERFVHFRHPPLRIANGVDCATFRPASEAERGRLRAQLGGDPDRPLFLFAGRFVEKKGLRLLHHLAQDFPDVRWIFAGWGPLDPSQWNLPNVSVRGNLAQKQLVPLYQAADLLVLPSVGEGFPLVVQEAMACGTPALVGEETAAGCPEAGDLLLHEPVDRDDAAARWRTRLETLMVREDTLRSLRARVAEFAHANWSWDSTAERYGEILRDAVNAR